MLMHYTLPGSVQLRNPEASGAGPGPIHSVMEVIDACTRLNDNGVYSEPLEEAIAAIARCGFDYVELWMEQVCREFQSVRTSAYLR